MGSNLVRRADRAVSLAERLVRRERLEVLRLARAVALAGLPKKRTAERDFSRTMRLGAQLWLRITYSAAKGKELPFGEDRFVLAGIQHLALANESPIVRFSRVGELLRMFGLSESGSDLRRLRERFKRLAGLSIHLAYAETEAELEEGDAGEQVFVIRKYALPTRKDLRTERVGQKRLPTLLEGDEIGDPYGVILSDGFWDHLLESRNRLLVPLELLKLFVDRPGAWDYAVFLVARVGASQRPSIVPHEALMALFKDSPAEADRAVLRRLQAYHQEIMIATGGRLKAEFFEDTPLPSQGGRPKKRWSLKVAPSESLLPLAPRQQQS